MSHSVRILRHRSMRGRLSKLKALCCALIVLCCVCSESSVARAQVQVTLLLSPHPSRHLADWRTRRETAQIQVINNGQPVQAIIDATIALEGNILARTRISSIAPVDLPQGLTILSAERLFPESAVDFQQGIKENVARTGTLPEGNYEICVRLLSTSDRRTELTRADCRQFSIVFQPPTLISPQNDKKFAAEDHLIQFLWTPISPMPAGIVQYNLRVVELLEGQTDEVAFRNNHPVFERALSNQTQLLWPPEAEQPKAGKKYAWAVIAKDDDGVPLGGAEGMSEVRSLQIGASSIECERLLREANLLKQQSAEAEKLFWEASDLEYNLSRRYQDAEERADARNMEATLRRLEKARDRVKLRTDEFNTTKDSYETKMAEYRSCAGK